MFGNNNKKKTVQKEESEEESFEEYSGSEDENLEESGEQENQEVQDPALLKIHEESLIPGEVFEHPIFSFKEDGLLGPLGEYVKSLLVPFPNTIDCQQKMEMLKGFLFISIFGNKQISQLKKEFKQLGLESKTSCGNLISLEEICFRCLDCEILASGAALTTLMCAECFDNSNHAGHRVIIVKLNDENTGYCDCGDSGMLKPEGFCPDHQRSEVDRETELKKFPAALVKNCKEILCKAFYGLMAIFELVERVEVGNAHRALLEVGRQFSDLVLGFLENGYTQVSNSFLLVLNNALESKFQAPFNKVWHDCDCLRHTLDHSNETHECKCSVYSSLLRYCIFTDHGEQPKIKKVLAECMKDVEFRDFGGLEMTKYCRFLFPLSYLPNQTKILENPNLLTLNIVLSSNEDLVVKMIRSEHFKNYIEVLRETVKNYEYVSPIVTEAATLFEDLTVWFANPLFKVATRALIYETNTINEILDILVIFQTKFYYTGEVSMKLHDHQVDYENMGDTLRVQKRISKWIEDILRYISVCGEEEKDKFFTSFAKDWYFRYETARKGVLENSDKFSITPIFERMLCKILRSYEYELTKEGVLSFFAKYLPEVSVEELAENVIKSILRSFGFIRFLGGVVDTEMEHLFRGYYLFGCLFYETDVLAVQKMVMIANPKNLLETIGDSFFSYDNEIKLEWKDFNSLISKNDEDMKKKKMIVMKDFLMFLVYLMSDELCLLNVNTRTASAAQIEGDPNNLRVIQKAATNVLLSEYWTEYGYLKENLSNSILLDESKIGRVITKISINNEKEQKIRVKDELETELDPYMFYKTPLLQADVINEATARIQKNQNIDIVAGKSYTDLQKHLLVIRDVLFQSNLPEFLREILKNFSNLHTLIPTTLKLILLHTQQDSNASYQIEEEILKREEFKECRSCIKKIKGDVLEGGDESEMKKKIGQEKMNKMKEEFLKKQAIFADKNKEAFEEGKEEKGEHDMMTCPYCLVRIDEKKDTYGIPVFINYTNNFTKKPDSKEWGIDSYNDLEHAIWMPVLSSCYHHYHRKCFGEAWRSVRESDDAENFKNPIEACCSLCKTLCNDFLLLNEGLEAEALETPEKPHPAVYYFDICQKMLNLLEDHRIRIALKPPAAGEKKPISFPVILKRMAIYFMETLHMNEKSNEFVRVFELYLNFYKSFKKLDARQLGFTEFVNDPLFTLVIQRLMILGTHQKDESAEAAFANFVRLELESLVNEKLSQITLQSIHCNDEVKKQDFIKIQIETLRQYVEIRLVQQCILTEGTKLSGLNDCALYYKNNMDVAKELVHNTLGISLRQFILHIYFNKCLLQGNHGNLSHLLVCEMNLDELLKLVEIPYTIESLLKECVESIEKKSGYLLLDSWIEKHMNVTQNQVMAKPGLLAPRFLQLPETFDEFNKTIYRRKCTICQQYDGEKNMHFCLLCGIVVCEGYCLSMKNHKGRGNMNAHATLVHMGTSMYYHLFENVLSIVASPYNVSTVSKSLYSDSFGQTIEEALEGDEKELLKIDFKQFVLNSNFVQELKTTVMNQDIEKEYFKTMINLDDEQEIPENGAL